jgi:hypothetical protein
MIVRKFNAILALSIGLVACAPSTDGLIREAKQSGNWTLVNQRLESDEEQMLASVSRCGDGKLMMCSTSIGLSKCSCVADVLARERFREITEAFR